jgi:hypothetical protein
VTHSNKATPTSREQSVPGSPESNVARMAHGTMAIGGKASSTPFTMSTLAANDISNGSNGNSPVEEERVLRYQRLQKAALDIGFEQLPKWNTPAKWKFEGWLDAQRKQFDRHRGVVWRYRRLLL